MSEVTTKAAQKGGNKVLINRSKGLRYVGGKKILPDNKGVEFTADELDALSKHPAFAARLAAGEFEIK